MSRDFEREMNDYLPRYYEEIREMQAIISSEAQEFEAINSNADSLLRQMFVLTATWGLSMWEEIVGIKPDETNPLRRRRTDILAKLQGFGTLTEERLREIVDDFDPTIGYEYVPDEYTIYFTVLADLIRNRNQYYTVEEFRVGFPPAAYLGEAYVNAGEFLDMMRVLLPAHIAMGLNVVDEADTVEIIGQTTASITTYRTVSEFRVGDSCAESHTEVVL